MALANKVYIAILICTRCKRLLHQMGVETQIQDVKDSQSQSPDGSISTINYPRFRDRQEE